MNTDILIIGGGVIGLACAVELKLRGENVTVLCRNFTEAAGHAAAGMLAPDAENIANEAMFTLSKRSLYLYPEWVSKLEELTGLSTGYWPCGVVAPVSQKPNNQSHSPGYWLDKSTIEQYQRGLGADIIGGWWYPENGQVNNQSLIQVLRSAAESLGIEFRDGVTVEAILQQQSQIMGVQTNKGLFHAGHYILAAGAWSNQLLPLPVRPCKGQMLRLRVPEILQEIPLTRVLYGENVYIVPRKDGSIIVGATVEEVGFTANNTAAGIQNLLSQCTRLYPSLADYSLEEMWWGFRPATPDELPILGESYCQNLTMATGHYRNGVLLAPVTAKLVADLIVSQKPDPLLSHFRYSRFENLPVPNIPFTHSANFTDSKASNSYLKFPEFNRIDSELKIGHKVFHSRLMTGTGKYRSMEEMQASVNASGCQIVTVAVRRVQTNAPGHEGLAESLDWSKIWMLPNTAGCQTAQEAIRVARLGREMAKLLGQEDNNFVKLEVIPDPKYLLPDPIGTLEAAEQLVKEGFAVLPYINADPMLAKRLEEVGCATVMPLAAPIGSGQGLKTSTNIQIIIENSKIPVVVDAGIGSPSEAAQAMELGADALLVNSAIALAQNAPAMAYAMNLATTAGRIAYLAGRMPIKEYASASSPTTGTITSL
ncbi:glycine oxidase ThiO [Cylindrospermopsis raciborskii CENA303]|uniref:Thiazole synthase n=1 Tax=Cylindrospermopsis raciborskii CENA303 TaxID=1170769 RepID=A0A1X4G3C1_9CYAN|nr:glycine oxidase ThiO [Cylindrospermopsis raciborskii]OSO88071.1 glycine oxidase ThiO [Cylindrospermopsis raciborskii CENA303]